MGADGAVNKISSLCLKDSEDPEAMKKSHCRIQG
ncbi:MAG: hypothetical protein CM1200mP3_02990 [Chloroflexota bacterium]|nr:MAG: hypothetical protein CM1200mP3_02990 [Chloroflexota bacterium]